MSPPTGQPPSVTPPAQCLNDGVMLNAGLPNVSNEEKNKMLKKFRPHAIVTCITPEGNVRQSSASTAVSSTRTAFVCVKSAGMDPIASTVPSLSVNLAAFVAVMCKAPSGTFFDLSGRTLVYIIRTSQSMAWAFSDILQSARQTISQIDLENPGYLRQFVLITFSNGRSSLLVSHKCR